MILQTLTDECYITANYDRNKTNIDIYINI